jgi:hypothetical protein
MNSFNAQKQKALQQEIAKIQESDPGLTFTAAWSKLRQQKPHLFAELPTTASYEPTPEQTKARKDLAGAKGDSRCLRRPATGGVNLL